MVFAIRRLVLRSRIPNCHHTYRSTPLHLANASIPASPRIWHQRSFSALARYNQKSDGKPGKKRGPTAGSKKKTKTEVEGDKQPALKTSDLEVEAGVAGTDTIQSYEEAATEVKTKENVADQIANEDTLQEAISTESTKDATSTHTTTQATLSDETKAAINVQPEEDTRENVLDQVVHETTLEDATSAEPPQSSSDAATQNPDIKNARGPIKQLITQDTAAISKWQRDIGLSDEELAYFIENYPGIDAELITAVKQGQITEQDLLASMEEDLEEQEEDLTPEQRAEFAKLKPALEEVGQVLHGEEGEGEGFTEEEMKQLGLTKEDIEALESEDPDNIDAARMERLQKAMLKLGLSAEEINSLTEAEADGLTEDDHDMRKFMIGFGDENADLNASNPFNDMYGKDEQLTEGPRKKGKDDEDPMKSLANNETEEDTENLSEEDLQQFLDEFGTEKFTPEMKELFKKAMKGDVDALEQMLSGLSETERKELDDFTETDEAQEQITTLFKPKADEVDSRGLAGENSDITAGGGSDLERFMERIGKNGMDPSKLDEAEFMKTLQEQLEQPEFTETHDGDVIRVHNVGSKEELAKVRAGITQSALADGPSGMDGMQTPKQTKFEALLEREGVPERKAGESAEEYEMRKFGFLDKEGLEDARRDREEPGFWNYGQENEDVGEDEEFQGDDLPSAGHAEVEQHRELREYARLAAWELPMLHKLAQPFEPPSKSTPLRFRYTTYMGEQHPASRKVVLEFSPSDIPDLTPKQTTKLIKLAGPRYNPSLDRVKMSCESFETQAQNKRYLGDLVYKLLKTAKDESTDGFEDVPIDERHVKRKAYHQFPERWKVTPQRRKELEERRVKELEEEEKRRKAGNLVDGVGVIHNALERLGMRDMVEERARGRVGAGGSAKAVRGRVTPGGKSSLFK